VYDRAHDVPDTSVNIRAMDQEPFSKWMYSPLAIIMAVAFLVLLAASEPRHHNQLFWCFVVTTLLLLALATILHNVENRSERSAFIRLFFYAETGAFVIASASAIEQLIHSEKPLWGRRISGNGKSSLASSTQISDATSQVTVCDAKRSSAVLPDSERFCGSHLRWKGQSWIASG